MLTQADRLKIERIRARWEATQSLEDTMGFRKASTATTDNGEEQSGFRRRLSLGLAFLSKPLGPRKPSQTSAPSLAQATRAKSHGIMHTTETAQSSPRSVKPTTSGSPPTTEEQATDLDATPKALPRSRTTSFIPRPIRSNSNMSASVTDRVVTFENLVKPHNTPSKIPSLSPPLSERRTAPRQHLQRSPPSTGTPNSTCVPPRRSAAPSTRSRPRLAVRSRTTPNLVNAAASPKSPTMQKDHVYSKHDTVIHTPGATLLQENVPNPRSAAQRQLHVQPRASRRESLPAIKNIVERKISGPFTQPEPRQQLQTPLTARKRTSANLAQQIPVSAPKRVAIRDQLVSTNGSFPIYGSISDTRPRHPPIPEATFFGPESPQSPTVSLDRSSTEVMRPGLPFDMTNGLGGFWRSSRSSNAAANTEVRVPRSYTFHNFENIRERTPPEPEIPEEYRSIQYSFTMPDRSHPETSNEFSVSGRRQSSPCPSEHLGARRLDRANAPYLNPTLGPVSYEEPPASTTSINQGTELPPAGLMRPWSLLEHIGSQDADIELDLQIKTYMPALYWAGRFQSRFDQWRTEAMYAELEGRQSESLLGQCKLDEEKLAACQIFAQLRDLCATPAAADSLWDFEYKYRKDKNMLSDPAYPLQQQRKQEAHPKGAFGRAVRKLTPRKKSFVNLWKNWNKGEDGGNRPDWDRSSKGS